MTILLTPLPLFIPAANKTISVLAAFASAKPCPERMSIQTTGFPSINGRSRVPLHYVNDRVNGSQVTRVETGAIATDMMKVFPVRNLTDKNLVRPPMDKAGVGRFHPSQAVSPDGETIPHPALVRPICPQRQPLLERNTIHFPIIYFPIASQASGECN